VEGTGGCTTGFVVAVVAVVAFVFAAVVVAVLEGLGGAVAFVVFGAGFDFGGGAERLGGGGGSSSVFYKVRPRKVESKERTEKFLVQYIIWGSRWPA